MGVEDIALQLTAGIGIKGAVHLIEVFGDAAQVFAASADELVGRAQLRPELAQRIVRCEGLAAAEREMAWCRKHGIRPVASTDEVYPPLLREVPDRPHVLYVQGEVAALSARCLSLVGTRSATPYGQAMCDRLVGDMAGQVAGLCIVSGLAFGIDVAAHRAALAHDVPTVAVLANALPGVTPAQHADVARDLLRHDGALVTELHSQSRQRGNFYLARNRIIAGLSAGCVVVESPGSGGSLMTAHYADGYHRTVMAVPGRVTDRTSAGTNHLIRTHMAQMVLSGHDILRELMWDDLRPASAPCAETASPEAPAPEGTPFAATDSAAQYAGLTADEARLLDSFESGDPVEIETLAALSGFGPGELAALLLGLELSGKVRQLPGNRYMRCP